MRARFLKLNRTVFFLTLFFSVRLTFAASISVMMPLNPITDWNRFRQQLKTLKNNGVNIVTTDVWWGIFEADGDNRFNWDYYRYYARVVQDAGLKWTPILSFHQCGGNIGDDCNIPLPKWVWTLGDPEDMIYRDRNGFGDAEYIAPWFAGAYQQYAEAMQSFGENFREFQANIPKVYLSMGPAGELRYPSYNARAGWRYPDPGSLQSYSRAAVHDFRERMRQKYSNGVSLLNAAWGTSLMSFDDIQPPRDGDRFFTDGVKSAYGRDYMTWYQGVLLRHLNLMKKTAEQYLLPNLPVALGAKVSGIHWQYMSPQMPHAAEYAAGYMEYESVVGEFARTGMDLTFTCLEMDDQAGYPNYSSPQGLVREISTLANRFHVRINGENALPISGNSRAYENIRGTLADFHYSGFTLLRLQQIVDPDGRETSELRLFRDIVIRNQGFLGLPSVFDEPDEPLFPGFDRIIR